MTAVTQLPIRRSGERVSNAGIAVQRSNRAFVGALFGASHIQLYSRLNNEKETTVTPDADAEISFVEFEVPNVNADAEISFVEFEVPTPNADAEVSFAEFEVPTPNADAEVSFVEFELPSPNADAEVSFVEFEVPTPNADAEVSFVEFEVPDVAAPAGGRMMHNKNVVGGYR